MDNPPHERRGGTFWACLVLGAAVVGYGLLGLWGDRADTRPAELAGWLAGAGVAHDFVVAPIVVVAAWLTGRLPDWTRTPVRLGLALSALVTLVFWPVVRGWGRQPSVPSALPLDYGRHLVVVLAAIWATVGLALAVRLVRRRAWRP